MRKGIIASVLLLVSCAVCCGGDETDSPTPRENVRDRREDVISSGQGAGPWEPCDNAWEVHTIVLDDGTEFVLKVKIPCERESVDTGDPQEQQFGVEDVVDPPYDTQ